MSLLHSVPSSPSPSSSSSSSSSKTSYAAPIPPKPKGHNKPPVLSGLTAKQIRHDLSFFRGLDTPNTAVARSRPNELKHHKMIDPSPQTIPNSTTMDKKSRHARASLKPLQQQQEYEPLHLSEDESQSLLFPRSSSKPTLISSRLDSFRSPQRLPRRSRDAAAVLCGHRPVSTRPRARSRIQRRFGERSG